MGWLGGARERVPPPTGQVGWTFPVGRRRPRLLVAGVARGIAYSASLRQLERGRGKHRHTSPGGGVSPSAEAAEPALGDLVENGYRWWGPPLARPRGMPPAAGSERSPSHVGGFAWKLLATGVLL